MTGSPVVGLIILAVVRIAVNELSLHAVQKPEVGVVTIPISEAGLTGLSNLVDILDALSGKVCLITGDAGYTFFEGNQRVQLYGVGYRPKPNTLDRLLRYTAMQLRISYRLARVSAKTWIFFIGGPILLLPVLTARLLGKKVVLAWAGSVGESVKAQSKILYQPVQLFIKASLVLSHRIVLYSQSLIQEHGLVKHTHKISIATQHFIDFGKFKIDRPLSQRDALLGYIGRLSEEKGVLNLMETIPGLLRMRPDIKLLIVGDGRLRSNVEEVLTHENLAGNVSLVGWVARDEVPEYLNELKLLVVPSYTEELPNIMLEAMACGTPVLATPVGAIPDVIKDEETGFIMEDNSPECISRNIIRALNHPNLEEIARNARAIVEKEFTYERALDGYRSVLDSLE